MIPQPRRAGPQPNHTNPPSHKTQPKSLYAAAYMVIQISRAHESHKHPPAYPRSFTKHVWVKYHTLHLNGYMTPLSAHLPSQAHEVAQRDSHKRDLCVGCREPTLMVPAYLITQKHLSANRQQDNTSADIFAYFQPQLASPVPLFIFFIL